MTPNAAPSVAISGTAAADAQPARPDVGEEIGVGVLIGVQVVDRDDLGTAHGLGGGQVGVERHEAAADRRAQQLAVDERHADVVGGRDVGEDSAEQRDQLVAIGHRREVAPEMGQAQCLRPLGLQVLGEP